MAGGTWSAQNKAQPGVYINFKSSPANLVTAGARGIVAIGKELSWGAPGELIPIASPDDAFAKLGYDINHANMRFLREIFRGTALSAGANLVYVYRLGTTGGAKAAATTGTLTATAAQEGVRGNDISIVVTPDLNTEYGEDSSGTYAVYTVSTVVDGSVVDVQTVGTFTSRETYAAAKVGDLQPNGWVTFGGTESGLLDTAATAGVALTGGKDGTLSPSAWADFLSKLEPVVFNVLVYDGTDATTKAAVAAFVQRVSYEQGRYCQAVLSGYPAADSETVISVKNGIQLQDGTKLPAHQATWWVGGATAGANYNQSLTYAVHGFAADVLERFTRSELDEAIQNGEFVFIEDYGKVKVLTDVNTFTSFTPDKGKQFRKNRVIRVLWSIANDIYQTFSRFYIGKIDNTEQGRNLLKGEIVAYLNEMQANGGIQNFSQGDVVIQAGNDADAVAIQVGVQPVDSVEKIYMTVTVA